MRFRNIIALAAVALATGALPAIAGAPAAAAAAADCPGDSLGVPDFDGSAGSRPDVAIGIPGEVQASGAVEVRYAGNTLPAQLLTAPDGHTGDRFGTAIVAEDVTNDGCTDLLIGAPGRDTAGVTDSGGVYVFAGSPTGLTWLQTITMGSGGMPERPQAGARFGEVLGVYDSMSSVGPFLAGMPLYDVGAATDAGAVMEFQPNWANPLLTQDSTGVADVAEAGDHFGAAVAGDYWEGDDRAFRASAPQEDVGSAKDAGAVFDCAGSTTTTADCSVVTQDSPDVSGTVEAGDRFGAVLHRQFIGIPGEDIGSLADAGMVVTTEGVAISQDTEGVSGAPESGDQFGAALARYTPSTSAPDHYVLQIGVPGEDIGSARDAGMVDTALVPFTGSTVRGAGGLSADPTAGSVQAGDRYGASLGAYEITESVNPRQVSALWLIGSPGDSSGAGEAITAETSDDNAALLRSQAWKQVTGTPVAGDGYGAEVSCLP